VNDFVDAAAGPLMQLLWATDPSSQTAILAVLAVAALSLLLVYGPLCLQLVRIRKLQRGVASAFVEESPSKILRREIAVAFERSPLSFQWQEFLQRWKNACEAQPQSGSPAGDEARAPVRLAEVMDEYPALARGPRRSLLPSLPGLFLATGLLGTFVGLTLAIPEAVSSSGRDQQIASLVEHVGLALRSSLWGLALSIAASFATRWIEGRLEAQTESLDLWVRRAYRAITPEELAMREAHTQRAGFDQLRSELAQVTIDFTDSLDTGLRRIEQSSAKAASLVSDEQRSALGKVVDELSETLKRGVEEHLGRLQSLLQTVVEHQDTVTGGLTHTFERMFDNSEAHARVTQLLVQAAEAVRAAADAIDGTARDFQPVLTELKEMGGALEETASRIQSTQEKSAHTADAVAASVEHSRHALGAQHQLIEGSLGEIRAAFEVLSRGLGENLSRALHDIDGALEQTVGHLRETILDSNETIDRLTVPIRAAEGAVIETRASLEQVKSDVVSLNDWLIQAARPVRSALSQLGDNTTSLSRSLKEFGDRARAVEHGMTELRSELRGAAQSQPDLGRSAEPESPRQDEAVTAPVTDGSESQPAPSEPEDEARAPEQVEESAEQDTQRAEGDTATGRPGTDAVDGDRRGEAEDEERPAAKGDPSADSTSGFGYRLGTSYSVPAALARSAAVPPAAEGRDSTATSEEDAKCDPEIAAAVSLSGLLSRSHSASKEGPLAGLAAVRTEALAVADASDSSTSHSEDPQPPDDPEREDDTDSPPSSPLRRLFNKKT
jgi:ABC-type transporter Mla subunit MlaD